MRLTPVEPAADVVHSMGDVVRPRRGQHGEAEACSSNSCQHDPGPIPRVAGGRRPLGENPSKRGLGLTKEKPKDMSNRVQQSGYCFIPPGYHRSRDED